MEYLSIEWWQAEKERLRLKDLEITSKKDYYQVDEENKQIQAQKSVNPEAALKLVKLMHELCYRCCMCGWWIDNHEYILWEIASKGDSDGIKYGFTDDVTPEEAQQLRTLNQQCGGWWYWNNEREEGYEITFVEQVAENA